MYIKIYKNQKKSIPAYFYETIDKKRNTDRNNIAERITSK